MISVTCAVIRNEEDEVLIVQRGEATDHPLKWEFPGGKVESGESVQDCVKRELREELSIDVDTIGLMKSQVNRYDDGGVFELTYCFVLRFTGRPVNNAFEEIRWVTLAELRSMDILEGNESFVSKLDESIFL